MLARKALAGTAGAPKEYVEDVFSTYLYTGTGATQTITNGIDLSTKGGLVWTKERTSVAGAVGHQLTDTARGYEYQLRSDSTAAQTNEFNRLTSFNTNGFTLGNSSNVNANTGSWVSFSFRKAKKFFDVVTYTGNGSTGRNISHNLGSTPGCIIIKSRTGSDAWIVYHRGADNKYGQLAATNAFATDNGTFWGNGSTFTAPTSTVFTVSDHSAVNGNGATYVAYLFAHDAGGFGDAGSDSIIKCDSTTTDGSGNSTVTLDWEPQFVMIKRSSGTGDWFIFDNMRKFANVGSSGDGAAVWANLSSAEADGYNIRPTATGFTYGRDASSTYIYIAIRRGPMKTPTSGTSVFKPVSYTGNGSTRSYSVGFPTDLSINMTRSFAGDAPTWNDRLRGTGNDLYSSSTQAESAAGSAGVQFDNNTNIIVPNYRIINGDTYIDWCMRRAPGFFDVVCYTGTGSNTTFTHNLGVVPELMIVKRRNTSGTNWLVYANNDPTDFLLLNLNNATFDSDSVWNDTSPTSTNFTLGTAAGVNASGDTYVAYLFASVSGVSKVGSYTGNGSSVAVTTDFQPRFIMVKRIDSTGNWIVSDSARGLVAGNDPYLLLNSTAAEDTDEDWVDVSSTGFTVNETSAANANVNTGTYIYLAIA